MSPPHPLAGDSISDSDSDSSASEDFRLQATGILMVSPPDSLEQKDECTPQDLFITPPEESVPASSDGPKFMDVDSGPMDDVNTVDLGRDTDLCLYSEVQLNQQTENDCVRVNEVSDSEAKDDGFSSDEDEVSNGRCSKKRKSKTFDEAEAESDCQDGTEVIISEESEEREDRTDDQEICNGENGEFQRDDDEVRVSVDNAESDEPIKLRETTDRHELGQNPPSPINVVKNNSSSSPAPSPIDDRRELTLSTLLKILKGEDEIDKEEDERLSKMSILEVAKRSGMTFPRPRWWPEEGF